MQKIKLTSLEKLERQLRNAEASLGKLKGRSLSEALEGVVLAERELSNHPDYLEYRLKQFKEAKLLSRVSRKVKTYGTFIYEKTRDLCNRFRHGGSNIISRLRR